MSKRRRQKAVRRDAQGRAHLVVHRDAEGRRLGLALSRPLFDQPWQDQVAIAAAATADELLARGRTLAQAVALARNAMAGTSKIAEGALAQAPDRPPACRAGCSHCCHQPVGVVAPEVFAIHQHLRATRPGSALDATAARVRAADDRTRGKTAAERTSPDHPCPFLEDGRCSIYDVRPLACRGVNSLDAGVCERALHDPEAHAAYVAGKLSLPCYLEPIRAFHAVTAGMQLAAHELYGLAMLPLELTAAVRIVLDAPEAVAEAWLAGKDPFAAARGGDITHDPLGRRLAGVSDAGG